MGLILASCGPEEARETEEVVQELQADRHELDELPADTADRSTCNLDVEPTLELMVNVVSDSSADLAVLNMGRTSAAVRVVATSFGDAGRIQSEGASVVVARGEARTVEMKVEDLELAERADILGGKLLLTAHAEFEDGTTSNATTKPIYYSLASGAAVLSATPNATTEVLGPEFEARFGSGPAVAVEHALNTPDSLPDQEDGGGVQSRAADESTTSEQPETSRVSRKGGAATSVERARSIRQGSAYLWKTLCFDFVTTFTDGGVGEDYYSNTTPTSRPGAYHRIELWDSNGGVHDFTLQASGGRCQHLWVYSGGFAAKVYAQGSLPNRNLEVREAGQSTAQFYGMNGILDTNSSQTLTVNSAGSTGNEALHIYQAAAFALSGHAGSGTGNVVIQRGDENIYTRSTGVITIKRHERKFTISHEVGHRVHHISGGMIVDSQYDTSLSAGSPCDADGSATWWLTSKEWGSAAYVEGFANFYSADAFNNHNEDDCWRSFVGQITYNCDSQPGSSGLANKYMQRNCAGSASGKGVILDWERVFWNVHTAGPTDPSMNEMLSWMASVTGWTKSNPYSKLDTAANSAPSTINARWDTHKVAHAIDYP